MDLEDPVGCNATIVGIGGGGGTSGSYEDTQKKRIKKYADRSLSTPAPKHHSPSINKNPKLFKYNVLPCTTEAVAFYPSSINLSKPLDFLQ